MKPSFIKSLSDQAKKLADEKSKRRSEKSLRRARKKFARTKNRQDKFQRRQDRRSGRVAHPILGHDEVFISGGKKFHTEWCDPMNSTWLEGHEIRTVHIDDATANGLEHCRLCAMIFADKVGPLKSLDLIAMERHLASI